MSRELPSEGGTPSLRPSGQFLVVIRATGPPSAERSSHGDFLRHFGVDFITVILPDKMRFADRLPGPTTSVIFRNGGDEKVAL